MNDDDTMSAHQKKRSEFKRELTHLLNRMGIDNDVNTPDFILAAYLERCLAAYHGGVSATADWHNGGESYPEMQPDV